MYMYVEFNVTPQELSIFLFERLFFTFLNHIIWAGLVGQ